VVNDPRRPMVQKIRISSLKSPACSERYIIRLKTKLPIKFTTSVPRGKVRAPLWTHPLIQYLNIPPIKLPIPIISHNGIYSPLSWIKIFPGLRAYVTECILLKKLTPTIICRLIGLFYAVLFQTNIVVP
jgi:hypothetical protein